MKWIVMREGAVVLSRRSSLQLSSSGIRGSWFLSCISEARCPGPHHHLVADLTDTYRTIAEIAFGNTIRQVRFVLASFCHPILLCRRGVLADLPF